ncbi:Protein of unknown function [Pyronema omphalodes CBS 100304]|uniref:Uncharacterized protein n=1 Tax=Pyronema omphalodes (strain CBS 100304) TaxID=1076935 RepID=U4L455_PYROM|nr:Protein of unknown function [Pyronema omphalodes CBS 100304]
MGWKGSMTHIEGFEQKQRVLPENEKTATEEKLENEIQRYGRILLLRTIATPKMEWLFRPD